jgi:hypothetical protein
MARCDLCGKRCEIVELTTLHQPYQVGDIKDLCRDCEKWATAKKSELLAVIAPQMREAIRRRAEFIGAAQNVETKPPSWRRWITGGRYA